MTTLYYITGSILLLIACIVYGMWVSSKYHDITIIFTVSCGQCGGEDMEDCDGYYQCQDCATITKK